MGLLSPSSILQALEAELMILSSQAGSSVLEPEIVVMLGIAVLREGPPGQIPSSAVWGVCFARDLT